MQKERTHRFSYLYENKHQVWFLMESGVFSGGYHELREIWEWDKHSLPEKDIQPGSLGDRGFPPTVPPDHCIRTFTWAYNRQSFSTVSETLWDMPGPISFCTFCALWHERTRAELTKNGYDQIKFSTNCEPRERNGMDVIRSRAFQKAQEISLHSLITAVCEIWSAIANAFIYS